MIDWLLLNILRCGVILMALWVVAVIGIVLMAVVAVVYHVFDPSCPTVVCFGG